MAHHRTRLPPFSLGAGLGYFRSEKKAKTIYRQMVARTPGIGGLTDNSLHICLVAGMIWLSIYEAAEGGMSEARFGGVVEAGMESPMVKASFAGKAKPMNFSLQNLAEMNSLQINIDRMNEINETSSQSGEPAFSPKGYDIAFEHVGFAYNSSETVLKDVSFIAKQGEVTALIGPSGGGKSTAAKLAARFWDIDQGRITVGGVDVSKVDPEKLLIAYSIVFQDVTLFNNTVMENIRIGRKDASGAEVIQAAKEAMCDEFITKLPQGYQTMIGENGSTLSGGERQRISIARALLKDAPIILLDEATASLDAENETEIQQAISRLVERKTVLIIAHRMRTVENANKNVVLSEGTVAEMGTPAELIRKNGAFARMFKLQTKSQNWTLA